MKHIFIHGLGQSASAWDKTISSMTKSYDIECPDLSELLRDKESTYENLYCAFSEYCDNLRVPLHLCGLSLGGVLALHYALRNPTNVHSLILIGAQYKMPKMLLKIQNFVFRFMPQSIFQNMGFQKKDIIRLTESMADLDLSGNLASIKCPTLITCGSKDRANYKAAKTLAANIPTAKFYVVENAGHEVNINSPQALAAKLESFYGNV